MFVFSMKSFLGGMVNRGWNLDELDVHIGVDVESEGKSMMVVERTTPAGNEVVQLQYSSGVNTVQVWWDMGEANPPEGETPKLAADVIAVINPDTVES